MIRAGILRKSCLWPAVTTAVARASAQPSSVLLARLVARPISHSVCLQNYDRRPSFRRNNRDEGEDSLEMGSSPYPHKNFGNTKSLHVARVPPETNDEEFRNAFSGLKGLTSAELVVNSGALRDYKNTTSRGYGFLHFESEEAAAAAAEEMEANPVRIQGYAVEVNPYKAKRREVNGASHVLHISGLPDESQFLEIQTLLEAKCPGFKAIRFMTGRQNNFLGAVSVTFEDTETATKAKEALQGSSLSGVQLLENNIAYGRSLWDGSGPTTTLMMIGTPKDEEGAYKVRDMIDSLEGVDRYKVLKDQQTGEFKGLAILNCNDVETAWKILKHLNMKTPEFRVAFAIDKPAYQQNGGDRERSSRPSSFKSSYADRGRDRYEDRGQSRYQDRGQDRSRYQDRGQDRGGYQNRDRNRNRDQDYSKSREKGQDYY